ncbi:MAG: hypothetical protein EAZ21_15745, partial [Betaproteobacteria bacterium]
MFEVVALAAASFLIAFGVCWALAQRWLPSPRNAPEARSLHHRPTPRGGGLGIACAVFFAGANQGLPALVLLALLALWCVSAWDDWHGASARLRLTVQLVAASTIILVWLPLATPIFVVLSIISLIWCLNLFNFMDGADGIAGLTALMGGIGLAILASMAPPNSYFLGYGVLLSTLALCVSAAALGFLWFNWPPAKIFMGDGGSTLLGLVLAVIALKGADGQLWPLAAPVALFAPFWADATYTLVRRLWAGHSPLTAHRDHFYQRLVLSGLGHQGLATWMFGWNLLAMIVAISLALASNVNETIRLLIALGFGLVYLLAAHRATKLPPSNLLLNPRTGLALIYDLLAVTAAWCALF